MYYGYDICPKCKDELIERKQPMRQQEEFKKCGEGTCSKCGRNLVLACVGKQEKTNAVYKINLKRKHDWEKVEGKYIEVLMKVGNCSEDVAKKKLNTSDEIIFEGDFLNTYLGMELLDDAEIGYSVIPEFPFIRYLHHDISMCPNCGDETIEKTEELDDLYIKQGMFCEKCNEWVVYCCISKLSKDETTYTLSFLLEESESKDRERILKLLNDVANKKILHNSISVSERADKMYDIISILESCNINYKIIPKFPYEIEKNEEVSEDFLKNILKNQSIS